MIIFANQLLSNKQVLVLLISIERGSINGDIFQFIVDTKLSDLEACVTSPSGVTEKCDIAELAKGEYSIKFVPKEMGVHTVSVKHRGIHIPGARKSISSIHSLLFFVIWTLYCIIIVICTVSYVYQ